MDTPITESDAIRLVIREGSYGDYGDVANAVRKRFGLIVGGGQVEQVYLEMQAEKEKQPESRPTSSSSEGFTDLVIQFVQVMGGFDQAREAITKLEATVRKLS